MKIVLIFFGPPGSGKGTQAQMVGPKLKLPIISPGELLRKEINSKTKLGEKVMDIVSRGDLVSDKIIGDIIDKRLVKKDVSKGFILDGYPRNKKQFESFIKILKNYTLKEDKVFAVLVDVSNNEVKARLGGRRVSQCGATYHLKFNPPKKKGICDKCGDKLYIRNDDTIKVINSRLNLYHKETGPILKYWDKKNKLIKINGEQSIKKVAIEIKNKLKKVL